MYTTIIYRINNNIVILIYNNNDNIFTHFLSKQIIHRKIFEQHLVI